MSSAGKAKLPFVLKGAGTSVVLKNNILQIVVACFFVVGAGLGDGDSVVPNSHGGGGADHIIPHMYVTHSW